MTDSKSGIVYLVGAGPGDPELLTLKAHRLLTRCDALVYDSLVPKEVLDLVPAHCERQFVGKRRGHHSVPQPSTNAVLVEMAKRHACVVRLKGGDPFLFGRGGEEAAYLAARNIAVEVSWSNGWNCCSGLRRNSCHPSQIRIIGDLCHRPRGD